MNQREPTVKRTNHNKAWEVLSLAVERAENGLWYRIGLMESTLYMDDQSKTEEDVRTLFRGVKHRTILLA